ncbi:MAG: biotin/lipoate A/B protein ligase family protein [Spirochaetota bacterium]
MNTWRLIIHNACTPSWNMAVDSAILRLSKTPTLRLYRWIMPAITIGYFQDIDKEVNIELCKKDGIPVIRRFTGGGAVFHHEELTYSLVHPLQGPFSKSDIIHSYSLIAQPLIHALHTLGVDAQYRPINDIIVGNRKISGSAQTRKEGKLLQHGTILVATDTEKMLHYLAIDPKKIKHEGKPVITLSEILKHLSKESIFEQLIKVIIASFKEIFAVDFEESDITQQEKDAAIELERHYFSNEQWNCRRLSP